LLSAEGGGLSLFNEVRAKKADGLKAGGNKHGPAGEKAQ
jgi:hypothetical protein